MKKRSPVQDIAKGLCMLAVLFCHTVPVTETADIILRAFLGFVIPFFFFISGYNNHINTEIPETFKGKCSLYNQRIRKRARQILIPLLVCLSIMLVLSCAYAVITSFKNGGTAIGDAALLLVKSFGGFWLSEPLSSIVGLPTIGTYEGIARAFEPSWFVLHMFTAYLVYYLVVDRSMKNDRNLVYTIIVLVAITMALNFLNLKLPWGLENAGGYASIMLLGTLFKKKGWFIVETYKHKRNIWINGLIAMIVCVGLGILFPRAGQISGSGNMTKILGIVEIPFTVLYSIVCSYYAMVLAKLINKVKPAGFCFTFLGKNSLMILIFHLLYMALAKFIVGVDLNASLAFVEKFDPINLVVLVVEIVLVSTQVIVQNLVKKAIKKRKEKKLKAA